MKTIKALTLCVLALMILSACGETVRGIGRDMSRIAHGTKTIFVSE